MYRLEVYFVPVFWVLLDKGGMSKRHNLNFKHHFEQFKKIQNLIIHYFNTLIYFITMGQFFLIPPKYIIILFCGRVSMHEFFVTWLLMLRRTILNINYSLISSASKLLRVEDFGQNLQIFPKVLKTRFITYKLLRQIYLL